MKSMRLAKIIIVLICIVILSVTAVFAQNWPFLKNAPPYTDVVTLITATTTTVVTGPTTTLGVPFGRFTCQTLWSGYTLTTSTVQLQGSVDGVNYATLFTRVSAASPDLWSSQTYTWSPSVFYIRAAQTAKTGALPMTSSTKVDCFAY